MHRFRAASAAFKVDSGKSEETKLELTEPLPNRRYPSTYRGGRRPSSRDKWSLFVSPEDARNVIRANLFAKKVGVSINAHVTINFDKAVPDNEVAKIIAQTLRNWRQWLRRRGLSGARTTHIWARERAGDRPTHVHILLHIPVEVRPDLDSRKFATFLPNIAGIDPDTIPRRPQPYSGTPVLLQFNDRAGENWGKYIIKGIAAMYAEEFSVESKRQGRIIGKRVGIAENVMHEEQRRWAFDARNFGHEFALAKWSERASAPKKRAWPISAIR
jgi:hypothetical protein